MVTPSEIRSMQTALDAARAEVDRAERAAGSEWFDVFRWAFSVGSTQQSARSAVKSARALYSGLVSLRDRAIESVDEEHELALEVIEVANRLSGRGTAESVEAMQHAASYSKIVTEAWESAIATAKLIVIGGVIIVAFLIVKEVRK